MQISIHLSQSTTLSNFSLHHSLNLIFCLNHLCEIVPPVSILRALQEVSVAQAVSLCIVDACIEGFEMY